MCYQPYTVTGRSPCLYTCTLFVVAQSVLPTVLDPFPVCGRCLPAWAKSYSSTQWLNGHGRGVRTYCQHANVMFSVIYIPSVALYLRERCPCISSMILNSCPFIHSKTPNVGYYPLPLCSNNYNNSIIYFANPCPSYINGQGDYLHSSLGMGRGKRTTLNYAKPETHKLGSS